MATPAAVLSLLVKTEGATAAVTQLRSLDTAARKTEQAANRTSNALSKTGRTAKHHAEEAVAANVALTGSFTRMARAAVTAGAGFAAAYVGIAKGKEAISQTAELAHNTELLRRNTGLYIKTASGLESVLKSRSIDAASANMAFQTLGRNIIAAETGTKRAQAAFMSLGISMKDLKQAHGDLNVLLPRVADGFANMKGGADRLAVSQALLGRGYRSLLPLFNEGSQGLQDQIRLADQYGATLDGKALKQVMRLVQAQRELSLASTGLKIAFTQAATPALLSLSTLAEKVARDFQGPGSLDDKLGRVGKDLSPALKRIDAMFQKAIPVIANHVGRDAPKVAAAFVRGFEKSDALGQAVLAAFILKRFGVFPAIAGRIGKSSGAAFAEKFLGGIALGLVGWDIGSQLNKHVPAVRNAAEKMAQVLTDALHPHIKVSAGFPPKIRIWFGNATSSADANAKTDAQALANSFAKNPKGVLRGLKNGGLPGLSPIPKGMSGVPAGRTAAINAAAKRYGISPGLLLGVYGKETNYGQNVNTSSAGAKGAFQFINDPGTLKKYSYPYTNKQTPGIFSQQAMGAAHYLSDLIKRNGGNVAAALTAYSGGGYSSVPGGGGSYADILNGLQRTGSGGKDNTAVELAAFNNVIRFLKQNYPGIGTLIEDKGTGNQHLHINSANHKAIRAIARKLSDAGFNVGEYGGKPIPGVGGITTLKHKHYGAADHYHGGAIDVNSDFLIRLFRGKAPVKAIDKPGANVFHAPSIKQSDILDFVQTRLAHYDLLLSSGLIKATAVATKKRSFLNKMLASGQLTGDAHLQVMTLLNELPKQLTPAQKTWTLQNKQRLAMAIIQANPGNVANLPAGVFKAAGASATMQNPWMLAYQQNLTNQVGAGAITQAQSDSALAQVLQRTLPFLTGQDAADVRTKLFEIATNTLNTANSVRASAISDAGFLGGLTGPAKDTVLGILGSLGIVDLPGGGNVSEIGNPSAASALAQSDIGTLMEEVHSGQVAFADVWPQILSDLQVIASGAEASSEASNAATDAVKALTDEVKRQTDFATSVANTESGAMSRWVTEVISKQMAFGISGRSQTPGYGVARRS